jgi:tetraacyldisaccharide 4'-kinase
MPWYAYPLAPFALIFRIITGIRNFLYDRHILNSFRSPIPTLVVGNLSVGGTGKTPMVEFLIHNLTQDYRISTLSRGYGRKIPGFAQASPHSTPEQIGDEPLHIYRKFGEEISVYVGEDRVAALDEIARSSAETTLVVLDDAFQHRRLQADLYGLLTPYSAPLFEDWLMPMGRLRESRYGAKRADFVVVTKCPQEFSPSQKNLIKHQLKPYIRSEVPVFFSEIGYGYPYPLDGRETFSRSVILISGLADARPFVSYCQREYLVLESLAYQDHHAYSHSDLEQMKRLADRYQSQKPVFLTTEKDAVKLKSLANRGFLGEIPIFVLPIEAKFQSEDKQMLLSYIRDKFKKR